MDLAKREEILNTREAELAKLIKPFSKLMAWAEKGICKKEAELRQEREDLQRRESELGKIDEELGYLRNMITAYHGPMNADVRLKTEEHYKGRLVSEEASIAWASLSNNLDDFMRIGTWTLESEWPY